MKPHQLKQLSTQSLTETLQFNYESHANILSKNISHNTEHKKPHSYYLVMPVSHSNTTIQPKVAH